MPFFFRVTGKARSLGPFGGQKGRCHKTPLVFLCVDPIQLSTDPTRPCAPSPCRALYTTLLPKVEEDYLELKAAAAHFARAYDADDISADMSTSADEDEVSLVRKWTLRDGLMRNGTVW